MFLLNPAIQNHEGNNTLLFHVGVLLVLDRVCQLLSTNRSSPVAHT